MYGQISLPKAIDVPKNFIYTVVNGLTGASKECFGTPKVCAGREGS